MMADIRQATMVDIPAIQACDLLSSIEEDPWDYFLYEEYIVFWPRLVYVAEDSGNGRIVGFVFAQVDGEGTESHGYIANLGVLPTHRKSGIAQKLMDAAQNALVQEYGCEYVSLHVRTSNQAAISLYTEKLGYSYATAANFYRNGEDAYVMRKQLQGKLTDHLGHRLLIAVAGRILLLLQSSTLADIPEIRACDLVCFPELDPDVCFSFFKNSILSPLVVVYVAEYGGRIVGYVVCMMLEQKPEEEDEEEEEAAAEEEDIKGYIDYLGVHPTCRKLGIAAKLMDAAQNALVQQYGCECVFLHVRPSNHAAINLYTKVLGYRFHYTEAEFYNDGEDAYVMRKQLPGKQPDHLVSGFSHGGGCFWSGTKAELLGLFDRLEIC
ncbi:hypothetical protein MKW92_038195 [Papaver armeniacum]|nr:hypothetical protein MKW92_038195 [Papaver armeniacum]